MGTKKNSKTSSRRPKPVTPKMGFTKDSKRRYGCGGKLKK